MITCKNCETSFEGKFCPNCAQKADTHRLTVKHFAHEFFHAFTHTDKGILFLIKELFLRPGLAIREYNEGKRKKYFNPITFLLLVSALQIYVVKKTEIFERYGEAAFALTQKLAAQSVNAKQVDEKMEALKKDNAKSMAVLQENSKLLTLLFIPVWGFITWLFFRKTGVNYAENLVMNVMISGQLSIIFLFLCALPFLIFPSLVFLWMTLWIPINWVYNIIVYKQFFGQRWFITIVKGLAVQILFLICTQVTMTLYVKMFG